MEDSKIIKVGTKVMWSGRWNSQPEKETEVVGIFQGMFEGDKEGYPIDEVSFENRKTCTFNLKNGHWCYGEQIHSII